MLKILYIFIYVFTLSINISSVSYAESSVSQEDIVSIFKRSMQHWKINYDTLDTNKSGAACIPWQDLDKKFINEGVFLALGYGFNLYDINIAKKASLEGCENMRKGNKIENTCECEMILYNDDILIEIKE
jgi:hypothetical protein